MNMDLFRELNPLINEKQETESFLEQLKGKNYSNSITLCKGICKYYFDDDLIPVLNKYFEEKIEELDNKISKFKLTKIIEWGGINER